MGNKHFSLLIETLELEEELSNTSLIDFSLNNIEKDNINKIWTFNFSGKNLPNSETLTLFIQKLRDSFSDDFLLVGVDAVIVDVCLAADLIGGCPDITGDIQVVIHDNIVVEGRIRSRHRFGGFF